MFSGLVGMPELIVRMISGHASRRKEFYRKISLAQGYQDRETETMLKKLKEGSLNAIEIYN